MSERRGIGEPVRPARRGGRLTLGELAAILFCGFTLQYAILISGYWRADQVEHLLGLWQKLAAAAPGRPAEPVGRAPERPVEPEPEPEPAQPSPDRS
jgi:hypothetical protein